MTKKRMAGAAVAAQDDVDQSAINESAEKGKVIGDTSAALSKYKKRQKKSC